MRLGWCVHLPGPFFLSGTIWRSKNRKRVNGYRVQDCGHAHRTKQAYVECCLRTQRRNNRLRGVK